MSLKNVSCHGWILALLALAGAAAAGEPTEEEVRAEAHRTVMRRIGAAEGAKTAELGLSPAATDLVDLVLDLGRNRHDIQRRRAPRSPMFMGTPHAEARVDEGRLVYEVRFVQHRLDRAAVPLAEVPGILAAALDAERFDAALVPVDAGRKHDLRIALLAELASAADEALLAAKGGFAKEWPELRGRIAGEILDGLALAGDGEWNGWLTTAVRLGGEPVLPRVLALLEGLPSGAPPWKRSCLVRVVCQAEGETARKFRRKCLDSGDPRLVATALPTVKEPDEEVWAMLLAYVEPGANPPGQLRSTAMRVLEDLGGDRARAALTRLFRESENPRVKYSAACTVTRMGSDVALPWLEEKLEELEKQDTPEAFSMRNYLKRLLEERGKLDEHR